MEFVHTVKIPESHSYARMLPEALEFRILAAVKEFCLPQSIYLKLEAVYPSEVYVRHWLLLWNLPDLAYIAARRGERDFYNKITNSNLDFYRGVYKLQDERLKLYRYEVGAVLMQDGAVG